MMYREKYFEQAGIWWIWGDTHWRPLHYLLPLEGRESKTSHRVCECAMKWWGWSVVPCLMYRLQKYSKLHYLLLSSRGANERVRQSTGCASSGSVRVGWNLVPVDHLFSWKAEQCSYNLTSAQCTSERYIQWNSLFRAVVCCSAK